MSLFTGCPDPAATEPPTSTPTPDPTFGLYSSETKLDASDTVSFDYFGSMVSVSADGNTALVGALYNPNYPSERGATYIYR